MTRAARLALASMVRAARSIGQSRAAKRRASARTSVGLLVRDVMNVVRDQREERESIDDAALALVRAA